MNAKKFFIAVFFTLVLWATALIALIGTHLQPLGGAPSSERHKTRGIGGSIPGSAKSLSEVGTAITCDVFAGLQV